MKYEHLKQLMEAMDDMEFVIIHPPKFFAEIELKAVIEEGMRARQELSRFGVDFGDTSDV